MSEEKKMKKKIAIVLGVALLVVAGAIFAAAEVGAGRGQKAHRSDHESEGFHGLNGRMAEKLNLTDAQKTQIKGIMDQERPTIQPLVAQLKENRAAMKTATANGQFDEAQVRQIASQQAQTLTNLMVEKARVKAKIYSVLTPEQRAKADQMRQHSEGHKHERGESEKE
jgi:protein CpxP